MAKKKPKRGMPSKKCVKCGATMHARKGVCPKCGAEQPKPEAKPQPVAAKARRPAAANRRRAVAKAAPGGLPQAVSFIRQVGGLDEAKRLLGEIEEIKKL